MLVTRRHRSFLAVALLALIPVFTACDDDETGEEPHDELPQFMELTVAGQTTVFDLGGALEEGDPITIAVGASVPVTARFLADDGDEIEAHEDEFELRVTNTTPNIVTFAAGGHLSGTLTGVAAGNGIVSFELWHLVENHDDWGGDISITVE